MADAQEPRFLDENEFTDIALDAQLDTFFLFEPGTGKALRWNRAFREASGYSDDEIAKLPAPVSYYSPADIERAAPFIQSVIESGTGSIELELICKDGRKVPTEYRVSVIRDEDGEARYLVSIGRDITERRHAEQEIRLLSRFPSENPYPVMRSAPDGLVAYANDGSADLLAAWGRAVGEPLPDVYAELAAEALRSGARKQADVALEDRCFSLVFCPVSEAGYVNIYGPDITERKRAEQEVAGHRDHLEREVRERTRELRTMVNAMAGRENRMSELKRQNEELREQIRELEKQRDSNG